jgi:hypothetical protein
LSGGAHTHVALTKGFDRAFLVGTGFAIVGAILAAILISSRDSREQSDAARNITATTAAVTKPPASKIRSPQPLGAP